jgi:hypothetical protein
VLGTQNRKQRSLPRGTGVRFKSARDATKIQAFHHNRRIELSRWREIPATSSLLEIGSGWSGEEKEAAGVDTPLLQRMRRSGGEELETRKEGKRLRCERKGGVGRDGSRDAAAARRGRSEGLTCNKLVAFWTQKESDGSKRNETKRNEEDEPADTHHTRRRTSFSFTYDSLHFGSRFSFFLFRKHNLPSTWTAPNKRK